MTLVEVMIAMCVLALAAGGVYASLMQSRRLTEGSVVQNSALTIVQGYVEQMKNMELDRLIGDTTGTGTHVLNTSSFAIPTRSDDSTLDVINTSTGSPPSMSTLTPGTTPSGVTDNLKNFDILKDSTDTTMTDTSDTSYAYTGKVNWNTVWPNATTFPATQVGRNDLKLNVWCWLSDLSASGSTAQKVFGITVIYTWQYRDGGRVKYIMGTVRAIRSTVPSF